MSVGGVRDLLARGIAHLRREGIGSFVAASTQYVYDRLVRPRLPRRAVTYNGVAVPTARALDDVVPWSESEDRPDHERALIAGIREHVQEGDSVVIVGGGSGASSVVAAEQVGQAGSVVTFEGAAREAALASETVRWNDADDRVEVKHAIVGDGRNLRGDAGDAGAVAPGSIPDCDVLVLDCEGCEVDVLDDLSVSPRVVVVETHGVYDAPPERIAALLTETGYVIRSREIGGRSEAYCRDHGIFVLVGIDREAI